METLGSLYHFVTYESNLGEELTSPTLPARFGDPKLAKRGHAGMRTGGMVAIALTLLLATPAPSHAMLRFGTTSPDVVYVQNRLRTLRFFNANSTGYFGPITQAAVIQFQRRNNLLVDGIVGPQTLNALNSSSAIAQPTIYYSTITPTVTHVSVASPAKATQSTSPPPVTTSTRTVTSVSPTIGNVGTELYKGSQGPVVTEVQTLLRQEGHYSGPITDYYGGLTAAAVEDFQRENGIPATGITGIKTLTLLRESVD